MSPPAKVLVVANRTADSDELRAALLERSERGPIEVTLLAPAAWEVADPHGGTESARRRLKAAITRLGADGISVRGLVGDAHPVVAVEEIWDAERFDEVIVSTLPEHVSRWLRLDLPHRVERLTGRPVQHVVVSPVRVRVSPFESPHGCVIHRFRVRDRRPLSKGPEWETKRDSLPICVDWSRAGGRISAPRRPSRQ